MRGVTLESGTGMREVTLEEVLAAREERAALQDEMIRKHGTPLISFSMNIAGPVKSTPLIRRAFGAGLAMIDAALAAEGFGVAERRLRDAVTGCEAMYAVQAEAEQLKRIGIEIEEGIRPCGNSDAEAVGQGESTRLGRLFDIDVIGKDGIKLARQHERKCLICGASGRGCASRRLHSVSELQKKTKEIIVRYFALEEGRRISELVTSALMEEVLTTPKPGLVDLNNNGSHKDMDIGTFERSAEALKPFWEKCFMIGAETAADEPGYTFRLLRQEGIDAEDDMLEATGGVNTHKGAVFLLGTVCGAIGRLYEPERETGDAERIAEECASMTKEIMETELKKMAEGAELAGAKTSGEEALRGETAAGRSISDRTSGEMSWIRHGMKGARGEIADGLPGVIETGLPVFTALLGKGLSRNDAGAGTLIALIARGTDTNMVKRGGIVKATEATAIAADMVKSGTYKDLGRIEELDRRFIELNLSPGGCADLLAITYFLFDYCCC